MIFYFSGTGNSEYVARKIAEHTGDALISINEKLKKGESFSAKEMTDDRLIFTAPVYGWRLPRIVEDWIMNAEFANGAKAYFILTCGSEMGDSAKYARQLCARKGFTYMGCAEVVMPENYIAMFNAPEGEEAKEIIRNSEPKTVALADCIKDGVPFAEEPVNVADKIKSTVVNPVFYKFFVKDKKFKADENCTGCEKCADECPLNNIEIRDGKPVWKNHCTHCMACITGCPTEAIEYGSVSFGKPRYRCPDL